jgi:hypothetical protein
MTIPVSPTTTLQVFIDSFTEEFPYLKLIFFMPILKGISTDDRPLDTRRLVNDFVSPSKHLFFTVHPWEKTKDVECKFIHKIKVRAEILRKYKDRWIVTLGSDELTIYEQNELGKEGADISGSISNRFIQ